MNQAALKAVYTKGVLRPQQPLPLSEQQEVLIIVLPLPPVPQPVGVNDERRARRAQMSAQIDAWLEQQAPDAVRPPRDLPADQQTALEVDFDATLARIRARAAAFNAAETAADVEAALAEVRAAPAAEQQYLEHELETILSAVVTDVLS